MRRLMMNEMFDDGIFVLKSNKFTYKIKTSYFELRDIFWCRWM